MTVGRRLQALWLGRAAYEPVHALQLELMEARKAGQIDDTVLFVEHEPTITLGRGATPGDILASEVALAEAGIAVVSTGRGGEVTLHAPGGTEQLHVLEVSYERIPVQPFTEPPGAESAAKR